MLAYHQDYFLTHTPRIGDNEFLRLPQKLAYESVRHFAIEQKESHAIVTYRLVWARLANGLFTYGLANGRVRDHYPSW